AHPGRHGLFAFEHRVDVARSHGLGLHEEASDVADRLLAGGGPVGEHHALGCQDVFAHGVLLLSPPDPGAYSAAPSCCSLTIPTTSSYFGEFMKLSTETWIASGAFCFARGVSSFCVITRSSSPLRFAMAALETSTSTPAFLHLLRSPLPPMAPEPL